MILPQHFCTLSQIQILYGTLDNFMETLENYFQKTVYPYFLWRIHFLRELIIDYADNICLKTLEIFSINLVVWIWWASFC